jgi:curli production assembly/transport component CsgF
LPFVNFLEILYKFIELKRDIVMVKKYVPLIGLSITLTLAVTLPLPASGLAYTPVNPSFGGNPFNSAHLFALANAQNQYKDNGGNRSSSTSRQSQAELFVRQLESRLLSSLAGQVTDAIFGENAQEQGEIVFGDQTISFVRGLEAVVIQISDASTGDTTEIRVPTLQVE